MTEPSRVPEVRATGHLLTANLELARGQLEAATAELAAAEIFDPEAALEQAALFAALPFLPPDRTRMESLRSEIERWQQREPAGPLRPRSPFALHDPIRFEVREYLRGLLSARLGDEAAALQSASRRAQNTRSEPPGPVVRDLARGIRSYLAQEQGGIALALHILATSEPKRPLHDMIFPSPFYSNFLERYRRGELLAALGRGEEALVWLEMITESSIYGQIYAAPSHRVQARIDQEMGAAEKTEEHLRAFRELWGGQDLTRRPEGG